MQDKRVWTTLAAILLIGGVLVWINLPAYGKISPHGYELATALYSACNQQDADKIAAVAKLTDQAAASNQLNPKEAHWLSEIINQARAERWQAAGNQTRQLMEAQVEGR